MLLPRGKERLTLNENGADLLLSNRRESSIDLNSRPWPDFPSGSDRAGGEILRYMALISLSYFAL